MGSSEKAVLEVTPPPLAPRAPQATVHGVFLALAVAVLALAGVLRAPGGETVLLPGGGPALPGFCTFKRWTGVDCPGCGLTRCFIRLAHGDVAGAWRYNPAGILVFAAVAFQVPFRLFQIARLRRGLPEWRWRALDWCVWLLFFALAAQWVGRLVFVGWP